MSVSKGESEGVFPGTPRVSRDVDSFYEFGGGRGVLIDDDCSNSDTYNTGTMANLYNFLLNNNNCIFCFSTLIFYDIQKRTLGGLWVPDHRNEGWSQPGKTLNRRRRKSLVS